ncbi:hypothetical protein [Nostoc sp. 106C]|jgi:hypothetical protein|uniref:hypothetical protein n=1 Tax=Nostoc sp. 106C TaxID=1932667 RepID=UPI000A38206E|nr:hypothetical protein [Nostoc sp. 106C]OUL20370.1 hypothetical protein BV375_30945 [Nostoc sp. 106C]OUL27178.1 hypothetical protein BV378_11015 [Nostoc sp. RF31YmG]
MMLINRLFKGLAVVLTLIGGIVIIWLVVNLVQSQLRILSPRLEGGSLGIGLTLGFQAQKTQLNLILLFIASAVETALFWLLVVLDIISRYRGLIATLTLFIFVGIVVFIVYSQYLKILG